MAEILANGAPLLAAAPSPKAVIPSPSPPLAQSPGLPQLPSIEFTTFDALVAAIDNRSDPDDDVLIVRGVSVKDFKALEKARSEAGRKFRFRHFDARSRTLIITIPTGLHEQLHCWLYTRVDRCFDQMGLGDEWHAIGAEDFKQDHSYKSSSEGDSTGGPTAQRGDKGAWPTLVIEAGFSQTLQGLKEKMNWWFRESKHQVKIVLLAKFDRHQNPDQNQIILEKWIEIVAPPRQGATTTRAAAQGIQLAPVLSQAITITRNLGITNTDPARLLSTSYTVVSGALRLEFERLFLRSPGHGEGDIVLSIQMLQAWAVQVWRKDRV